MASELLYVCMTMDVERIREYSPTGGPPSWAFAARSVQNYCGVLAEHGLPATLFVVPDTAVEQGTLLQKIAEKTGAELGLHMHPQCWKDHHLREADYDYLGGYTAEEQYEILSDALLQVGECLGVRPRSFRGGNFSANDDTFRVLADLDFTHGSVSQPGRSAPRFKACWHNAHLDVHCAHGAFRHVPGDLNFVEVPLTSDQLRTDHWTGVGDVRIENASAQEIAKAVRQEIGRQVGDDVPIKHVCLLTHNFVNYWSEDENEKGRRGVLMETIRLIEEIATDLGLKVQGATTEMVRNAYMGKVQVTGVNDQPVG